MKILIHYDFNEAQLETFRRIAGRHGNHEVIHATSDDAAIELAPEAEVLLGVFLPKVCAAAPKLRWIQSVYAGLDGILWPEIIERDVMITNMAGIYASQGAEHAWALLLSLTRGVLFSTGNERRSWPMPTTYASSDFYASPEVELTGGTLGIIGLGGFGMEMVKRARGYDMSVLAIDPVRRDKPDDVAELNPSTRESLHDLLRRSDAVMLACPMIPETYHLMGQEEFAAMKTTAYLVSVTHGGVIDEAALIDVLKNGEIAGAGMDCTEIEPPPPDSPLWDAPNLIMTPHRAGTSQHRPRKIFEFFCENLEHYLKGEQLRNIVDKKRGF